MVSYRCTAGILAVLLLKGRNREFLKNTCNSSSEHSRMVNLVSMIETLDHPQETFSVLNGTITREYVMKTFSEPCSENHLREVTRLNNS
jgi:hypothetical protein